MTRAEARRHFGRAVQWGEQLVAILTRPDLEGRVRVRRLVVAGDGAVVGAPGPIELLDVHVGELAEVLVTAPAKTTRHALRANERALVDALNPRQRLYLREAYSMDQGREAAQREAWHSGRPREPASVWRWLPYSLEGGLYYRIPLGERDPGTGATWRALDERGLLERRWEPGLVSDILYVRLTTLGRRIACAAREDDEDAWEVYRRARAEAEAERKRRVESAPRIVMPADVLRIVRQLRRASESGSYADEGLARLADELLARAEGSLPDVLLSDLVPDPIPPDQATREKTKQRLRRRSR